MARFFCFGQNKVPFMKYIHFAHIFHVLSSKSSQIMPQRSLGTLINFAGYATHNTHQTTAQKVFKNNLCQSLKLKGMDLENRKRVCTFQSQSNLISFESELHSTNVLRHVINHYPPHQVPMSHSKKCDLIMMPLLPRCVYANKKYCGHCVIPETIWKDLYDDNIH
jgi:hypothetical protein